jgi:hypothetical protein
VCWFSTLGCSAPSSLSDSAASGSLSGLTATDRKCRRELTLASEGGCAPVVAIDVSSFAMIRRDSTQLIGASAQQLVLISTYCCSATTRRDRGDSFDDGVGLVPAAPGVLRGGNPVGVCMRRLVVLATIAALAIPATTAVAAVRPSHSCATPRQPYGLYKSVRATRNLSCAIVDEVLTVWQQQELPPWHAAGFTWWEYGGPVDHGQLGLTVLHTRGHRSIRIIHKIGG